MVCPNCKCILDRNADKCPNCGTAAVKSSPMQRVCQKCGKALGNDMVCPICSTEAEEMPVNEKRTENLVKNINISPAPILQNQTPVISAAGGGETKLLNEMSACPQCGSPVEADDVFCMNCGCRLDTQKTRRCPTCGLAAAPSDAFCMKCGTPLGQEPDMYVHFPATRCPECGAENGAEKIFCANCGARIK